MFSYNEIWRLALQQQVAGYDPTKPTTEEALLAVHIVLLSGASFGAGWYFSGIWWYGAIATGVYWLACFVLATIFQNPKW